MKKILALLISVVMLATSSLTCVPVHAADYTKAEEEAATKLFQYLNPSDERTKDVYTAYKAKDYRTALELYRDYFINKLRRTDVGQLGWHDSNLAATYVGFADIMCGLITEAQYAELYDDRNHYDYLEWNGDPDEKKPINWLGGIGLPENEQGKGKGLEIHFRFLNPLPAAYWKNGYDDVYLKKYQQIIDDFCLNHRKVTSEYYDANPDIEPDVRYWSYSGRYAQNFLAHFERINNTIRCLGYFAKLAESEEGLVKPEWQNVGLPVDTTITRSALEKFDPVFIAHYAHSMIVDHLDICSPVLKPGFLVTNQHVEGVIAIARVMAMFDEFTICDQYDKDLATELKASVETAVLPDGSLAELSFNYNEGTVKGYEELVHLITTACGYVPEYAESYFDAVDKWAKMKNGYMTSAWYLPHVGNGGTAQEAAPIWRSETDYQKRQAVIDEERDKNADYDSVYFPFGGFGALRSGWDLKEDMSLNYYNNYKKSNGHSAQYVNAVTFTAYGRPMIATGGTPWYGESFAPESQKEIYEIMNAYFEESSTYKGSTVIANGSSQNKSLTPYNSILKSGWMTGENFDYGDGIWEGGYVNAKNVTHGRRFIYLKDAGLYLVEDTLQNNSSSVNTYSQIWRMPCYNENYANYTGFKDEQVSVSNEDKTLKTTDTTGPNIYISNFSINPLNYVKYCGSLENDQAIGWSHGGTSGERLPATDVHISWEDTGKGTSIVASVLDPIKDSSVPYKEKTDMSDAEKGITAFKYVTEDDVTIHYFAAAEKTELVYDNITAKAQLLIVTQKPDGAKNAFVFGADSVLVNGNEIKTDSESFEFTASGENAEILNNVVYPTYFTWVESLDGSYSPKYDALSEDVIDEFISKLQLRINMLRILRYNDSHYILKYSEKCVEELCGYFEQISEFPSEASVDGILFKLKEFIDKNNEIALFYSKAEYSDKLIENVYSPFVDKCFEFIEVYKDNSVSANAYAEFVKHIVTAVEALDADNTKIAEWNQLLNESVQPTIEENVAE